MTIEWILPWVISVGIACIASWVTYRWGVQSGASSSARFIVLSIIDSGKMTEKQIAQACQRYWEKLENQGPPEDEGQ